MNAFTHVNWTNYLNDQFKHTPNIKEAQKYSYTQQLSIKKARKGTNLYEMTQRNQENAKNKIKKENKSCHISQNPIQQ